MLRSGNRLEPPRGDESRPGSVAVNAMDIAACDSRYAPVLQLLLGRTLIVPDMDAAIAVSRRTSGWNKIVTYGGELLTPGGALTGGSLQGRGAHLVGRKGEIDDLRARIPALLDSVTCRTSEMERAQQDIQEIDTARAVTVRQEVTVASEAAAAESALKSAERETARLVRVRQDQLEAEQSLAAAAAAAVAEIERLATEVEAGSVENETMEDSFSVLADQTRGLATQRDACRTSAVALEVEVSRLLEKREGLTRAIAADRASVAGLQQQHSAKIAQRATAERDGREAIEERDGLIKELEASRVRLRAADEQLTVVSGQRQALVGENAAITSAIRAQALCRGEVTKNLHDTEVRLARLEIQMTQAVERLRDEYSIEREEALARPGNTTIDRNTSMEVGRLRRELRTMGHVNTGAVEEYDRLTERFDFLTGQRADLDRSRESLLKTIEEIDESTRGVFLETFDSVRVEFERLFTRLFEGGSTKLLLTKPDDVLETGIDVVAQPPGKKAQHLSLLSGGERALTATALLFAFLAVRPSPFVLLDEVDAPLDGVNVEKFTRLVKDFSERSQFLLITHNPTTMEAAPNWYGITMREPGVSSVLSYRVPQETTLTEEKAIVAMA